METKISQGVCRIFRLILLLGVLNCW